MAAVGRKGLPIFLDCVRNRLGVFVLFYLPGGDGGGGCWGIQFYFRSGTGLFFDGNGLYGGGEVSYVYQFHVAI